MRYTEYFPQVKEWALKNFGDNKGLKHFAPLSGIAEEMGELLRARLISEKVDAVGDVGIYLADFCSRLEIDLDDSPVEDVIADFGVVIDYYCQMHYVCLKGWQEIRGFDDKKKFKKEIQKATQLFFESFVGHCTYLDINFLDAVDETWKAEVSKRNWVENPSGV